jgi:ubiquinone/menaquinone biosynthesis C-methylase UbiE
VSLYGRLFAALYDRAMADTEERLAPRRAALLARAHGRVLELGAGTGVNVDLYPDTVAELVLTEPEEPMARRLERRLAATGRPGRVLRAGAEALPLADGSCDTVVATLVLCTVEDPERALAEVRRVLAPGGRLLALEHVRSPDPGLARRQDLIRPLHQAIGHGCRCNRDTPALLEASGLRVEQLERFRLPKAPSWVRPAVQAVAVREA